MISVDEKYMRMCFALAKKGYGKVAPNPMVGCVVLDRDGNLISKGYHKKYGENHAERDALLKLKNNEAEGGTLYVNLEPCSHFGKTPPCVDLIIKHKLKRVVIGMKDVNPKVDGITKLKNAGIEVDFVLEEEARFLNRMFIKTMTEKMPYVVLKTASTMDGKIASKTGSSKWITSETARKEVYRMRKEFDCIMTSSNTVIADNPSMQHNFKCILDKDLRTPKDAKIYQQGEIYIASKENTPLKDKQLDIEAVLKNLYSKGIYSVFVECGGTLAGSMLKDNLIDEVYQFIAPKILNDNNGLSCFNGADIKEISQAKNLKIYELKQIEKDILIKAIVL
ncbi:TPA: riboflavin biosynthesis protein RibD [Candidatus Gastranaerophilales bacterium HUM_5]|nr:MAG TPA: riboflavin biosynthesis protein RibD [Candidatus Gastranaerophilales bacterium HUM_4]DAA90875.1 MAG TPA: riboflavin biosynthesis protein RibD [Candidatus Gastranaerophilales bacterium HUM_5]